MLLFVEHNHTTHTTRGDDMTRIKARRADISTFRTSDGIGRILEKDQVGESLANRFPIGDISNEVWEEETLCLGCHDFLEMFNGGYIGGETYITEHGFETQLHERGDSRSKSTSGGNDFRSLWEIEGTKTEENRTTSRVYKEAVLLSEEFGDSLLKLNSTITKASEPAVAKTILDSLDFLFTIRFEAVWSIPDFLGHYVNSYANFFKAITLSTSINFLSLVVSRQHIPRFDFSELTLCSIFSFCKSSDKEMTSSLTKFNIPVTF